MAAAAPHVSVQPDRVTFTVQHEIEINYGNPPRAAASESDWLSSFTKIIEAREFRGWGQPEVPPPQIQALYHSSALPVPIGNAGMQCQSVTNGLVSACLFAFAKVCPSPSTAKNPRDFACIVLTRVRCSTSVWCSALTTSSFLCSMQLPLTCSKTAKRRATCLCRTRVRRCAAASPEVCVFIT